ncbi:MAG: SEC-C domain-containing protein [Holosporaceae bacterium]|nr:SEC-C domain-containing protein [Holosporaceae bacterium]
MSRNALCPCGSGLRYKNCCGKIHYLGELTITQKFSTQFRKNN